MQGDIGNKRRGIDETFNIFIGSECPHENDTTHGGALADGGVLEEFGINGVWYHDNIALGGASLYELVAGSVADGRNHVGTIELPPEWPIRRMK